MKIYDMHKWLFGVNYLKKSRKKYPLMNSTNYPFAQELITDTQGNIRKVVLKFEDYQHLLEVLEDEALYQAMRTTADEIPMNRDEALKLLEEEWKLNIFPALLKIWKNLRKFLYIQKLKYIVIFLKSGSNPWPYLVNCPRLIFDDEPIIIQTHN